MAFLRHVSERFEENGEYVGAEALTPARTWVRYGGPDAAPETSDLVAGWYMIDVESHERALELAAYVSSEPARRERCTSGSTAGVAADDGPARPRGPTGRLAEGAFRRIGPRRRFLRPGRIPGTAKAPSSGAFGGGTVLRSPTALQT